MTRKDYIRLAEDLRIERRDIVRRYTGKEQDAALNGFNIAVNAFCDAAKRDNANFDRSRFWDAVLAEKEFAR